MQATQQSGNKFDLAKYSIQAPNARQYFKIVKEENKYCVYDGTTVINEFQYFEVKENSKGGKCCKQFIEKHYIGNKGRLEYFEDIKRLIEACEIEAVEKGTGIKYYLKYWNDCLTEKDKTDTDFRVIQHFEALKDWYNIKLQNHIRENENLYLNNAAAIKDDDIQQWSKDTAKEVEEHLRRNERVGKLKFSGINSVQANELIKFCEWIIGRVPVNGTQSKLTDDTGNDQNKKLVSIFNENNNSFEVCKGLLEELEITIAGIPHTTPGKMGKLTGLIAAIKRTPGMLKLDRPTDQLLLTYFNSYLNTKYKSFSKRNEDYNESIDTSNRYIKQNFRK